MPIPRALLFGLPGLIFAPLFVSGQSGGPLTPPGAPGQTMKSLDEMEPRTPLVDGAPGVSSNASGTITISRSGSYFLTDNLTVSGGDGISIKANGVTLDLRGFTISSTAAVAEGVAIDITGSNLAIFNGHIVSGVTWDGATFSAGPGFDYGVFASAPTFQNIRVRDLTVQGVRVTGIGITAGKTALVESCVVVVCGELGIFAGQINQCIALTCGAVAIIGDSVSNARGESVGSSSDGIRALVVSNSYGISSGTSTPANGITADGGVFSSYGWSGGGEGISCTGSVSNSFGQSLGTGAGSDGIFAFGNVVNSYGRSNGDDGIQASGNVSDSYGSTSGSGNGIKAANVTSSFGEADGPGNGIDADGTVANSWGESGGGSGILASRTVTNSYGRTTGTGDGIATAGNVMNSYGWANAATADDGIDATHVISFSFGISDSTGAGVGLECVRAVGCTSSGGENVFTKYLMP